MTVGELYRVLHETSVVHIVQDANTFVDGAANNIPMYLMDAHINYIKVDDYRFTIVLRS